MRLPRGARMSRREWLRATGAAAMAVGLTPRLLEGLQELQSLPLIRRAIPKSGELLPAVGLGSANTFSELALEESRAEEYETIGGILQALVDGNGAVLDTAYGYGASEQVLGQVAEDLGIAERIWWSTKVNAAAVGGGLSAPADLDQTRYQIQRSFLRLRLRQVDLFQVHNMGDPVAQLSLLKQLKSEGFVRYVGVTTTFAEQYSGLLEVMRNEPIDFIGIDYAIDGRLAEEEVLPLASERGIGVLAYQPFGRDRMWGRIGDRSLPGWAADFDAHSWAHFMLKFVIAHPSVTVVCPGTSDPAHMVDNLGAGRGRLPDEDQREQMVRLVESLPSS